MSIWFFLWLLIALFLIGATAWSTLILLQQKQAWKNFANKNGLDYRPGRFFAPCEMYGNYKGLDLAFFTAEQQNPDVRKNRQLTVMQITDPSPYFDALAVGTAQVRAFVNTLDMLTPHDMSAHPQWKSGLVAASRNKAAAEKFLTDERLKIILGILSFPKSDILLIFEENEAVFRFETSNPLSDVKKLEMLMEKMKARIDKLRPSSEEHKVLQSLEREEPVPTAAPDASEVEQGEKPVGEIDNQEEAPATKKPVESGTPDQTDDANPEKPDS